MVMFGGWGLWGGVAILACVVMHGFWLAMESCSFPSFVTLLFVVKKGKGGLFAWRLGEAALIAGSCGACAIKRGEHAILCHEWAGSKRVTP